MKYSNKIPRYYNQRQYIFSSILYLFLVFPIFGYIYLTNINSDSNFSQGFMNGIGKDSSDLSDSLNITELNQEKIVTITTDTLNKKTSLVSINISKRKTNFSSSEDIFDHLFLLIGLNIILIFIYGIPYKIYFYKKRKRKKIPEKLNLFIRKTILKTPLIYTLIYALPYLLILLEMLQVFFFSDNNHDATKLEKQFFYISLIASTLTILFIFYWQRHRVHLHYIEHIFSAEELRKKIFKKKSGKIRNYILFSNMVTTLLPLTIVLLYVILSLTAIDNLNIDKYNLSHQIILFGNYLSQDKLYDISLFNDLFYINAINSVLMFGGIISGISVSFFYIILFVKWTTEDITIPVKALLNNIKKTNANDIDNYSIVRSNNEIGELTEGFNHMSERLQRYVKRISNINKELEEKVEQRTKEIANQNEEIKSQRDSIIEQKNEIEAQRDTATTQRDMIGNQNVAIKDSIQYGRSIQYAVLPQKNNIDSFLKEYFILFKPRDIVSGDFYWFAEYEKKVIVAAIDCTGHGVPGAFMSMLGVTFLNQIVNKNKNLHANMILNLLRENVIGALNQKGQSKKLQDGMDMSLCIIDFANKTLEYAGAYNPLFIIRKGELIEEKADKMPVGFHPKINRSFTNNIVTIENNDMLYLFSDGYHDQLGGNKFTKLLKTNFIKILKSISELPAEEQNSMLEDKLKQWQGNRKQIDDILVIGIKIKEKL